MHAVFEVTTTWTQFYLEADLQTPVDIEIVCRLVHSGKTTDLFVVLILTQPRTRHVFNSQQGYNMDVFPCFHIAAEKHGGSVG